MESSQTKEVNQVMIVDSSIETTDESSERQPADAEGSEQVAERKVKRFTIVDTMLAVRNIKVEELVNGIVVNTKNYIHEKVVDKKEETFEDSYSSISRSYVSSSSSSKYMADISSDDKSSLTRAHPKVRKSVIDCIDSASQEEAYVERIFPQRFDSGADVIMPLSVLSPDPLNRVRNYPKEFPSLGSSPERDAEKDSSKDSLFKYPSSQYHLERHRGKKSSRFSSSTSISEEDRLSMASRGFIPEDISSIHQSASSTSNPLFTSSLVGKISPVVSSPNDSHPREMENRSPSLKGPEKAKQQDDESSELFSSSSEREKEFQGFPQPSDKSESLESSGGAPDAAQDTDIIPPTESEVSDKDRGVPAAPGVARKMRRPRLAIRRYSMIRRLSTIAGSPAVMDTQVPSNSSKELRSKTLQNGTLVYTRWTDGHFYPGRVDRFDRDSGDDDGGKFSILFDDGHLYEAVRSDIVACDLVPMNSTVMAERLEMEVTPKGGPSTPRAKRSRWSEVAEVVGHATRADGKKSYMVKFRDGKEAVIERGKVTLALDQATRVFGSTMKSLDVPKSSILSPDISADNLVEGKRKRKPLSSLSDSGPSTPRSKRKKFTCIKEKPESFDLCPPIVVCSPGSRRTPAGVKRSAKRALDLNCPVKVKSNVFGGLTFLITHVWKSPAQLRRERSLFAGDSCPASVSASASAEPEIKPMNRDLIISLIKDGGGTILEDFSLEEVSKLKGTTYLVSDSPQRTIKYLCCLAFGIPCVYYNWIVDSAKQNNLENYSLYLLPAGYSIERELILSRDHEHYHLTPLKGIRVVLHLRGDPISFSWRKVLRAAGCRVSVVMRDETLEDHVAISPLTGAYLVTDSNVFGSKEREVANRIGLKAVSTEWVVQCIINEFVVDPQGSARYRP